ncbi:MAG: type IV secretion protein IcmK [Legionellales bacterium RIFCSPHIGHO2_12_FULL_35_11]|nr:MAG: type IV secretion protein IcmK [Legionellales bacterium RIFCSPHIGHO2_12_FULL_35_11]
MKNLSFAIFLIIGAIAQSSVISAAGDQVAAKQALEQLRMLQGSLTAKKDQNKLEVENKTSPKAAPAENKEDAFARRKRTADGSTNKVEKNLIDEQSEANDDKEIDEVAFEGVEKRLFPLNSEKIIKLHELYNKTELAKTQSPEAPPKPIATSQIVNLSPGSTPPVIRLSQGFVSSLVFLDSTGAPWPISAYDLGDPTSFNIQWDKVSNTMMIQSNKLYTYGNLAVRLQNLNTPVMLTLIPGQKAVDYRVDLRIQGYGPNAKNTPMEEGLPPSVSDILLHVLDGVPPPGSTRLVISGGDARGWLLSNKMYIRTNLTILSPGWIGSMTSADGMHAYEMQKSPVLLVSWHGKVMQLKVEGF